MYFSLFLRRKVWSSVTEERLRFVARVPDGGGHDNVCRDFGVSHKTGCKIFDRYKEGAGRAGRSVATPVLATWCYRYVVLPTCPGPDI